MSYASVVNSQKETKVDKDSIEQLNKTVSDMKDTNEKYIKDMAIIKNNLNKIINVTTHTQNKLSDFEDKISKEINHTNKEIVTKTSNESLAVILFELTYVILSQKMKSKIEMVTTVMAIMDRHSFNLNKKK